MIKPKRSLENLIPYEVPLFEQEWDLKIDSNENLYGPSPKVLEAIRNVDPKDILFYPYYGELSQKIADYAGFEIDNIKVTNGADEAISSIFTAYLDPEDAVLTVTPSFAMPVVYSQIIGSELIEVPYEKKWEFPIDAFLAQLENSKIKIVHLTTPNNPTGETISEENITRILQKSKDKLVLIDETYGNYCNSTYRKFVKQYDNVFIVKSFSKDFALAGLRLGYIISNPANIKILKAVVSPYSVNSMAVKAGIAALDDCEYFEVIKEQLELSKAIFKEGFEKLGAKVYPSGANFLCVDFAQKSDFVYKKLVSCGICVKKYNSGVLNGFMRITAPKPSDAKIILKLLKTQELLAFDMDGVLFDVGMSYRMAIKRTFEYFSGKELPMTRIQEVKNKGGLNNDWELTAYLLRIESIAIPMSDVVEKFQEFYWNEGKGFINDEELLIDKSLLSELAKKYNLAIFTGRPKLEAEYALKKHGIFNCFSEIITMDSLASNEQKPSPAGLNLLKNKTGIEKIMYFGDTVDDVTSALGAKAMPIGVLPPQDKSEDLASKLKMRGAALVINTINEIEKALELFYETQH